MGAVAVSAVDLVRRWYDRMNRGDVAGAVAALHPDIEWIEAEHSPYGWPGAPLVGPVAIAEAVWSKLARDWVELRVVPEELLPAGDAVVVLGRYVGVHARSGAPLDAQVVHVWNVLDGKIVRYRGFADTWALHEATATADGAGVSPPARWRRARR